MRHTKSIEGSVYKVRRYQRLRSKLKARGIDQAYLAQKLGRSLSYVSSRFRGVDGWTSREMYLMLDWIGEPEERLHVIFPPDGIDKREEPKAAAREVLYRLIPVEQ